MLEIAPEDILALNDTDLRELVGRLCEAEVQRAGQSPAAATWGGSQTTKDGGVDVHVALPAGATWAEGFIPRPVTGFQVKKPDMAAKAIKDEMRPGDVLRPVIVDLASAKGAYVIVSSSGTTSHTGLSDRRQAMREAVSDLPAGQDLHLDFYDRRRLATWVNSFPGVILWARERAGRVVAGWRPWGAWTSGEGQAGRFIVEDALRARKANEELSTAAALEWATEVLAQPGKAVRLVGLSGVGKTRFAQALFEHEVTAKSLDPALAVYTNMNDGPTPQPVAVATNLIAAAHRAVLVVDNCTPALHRQLAELCAKPGSVVSLLTIEYDVREDQPEGTEVLGLEPASEELIDTLLRRRFTELSGVDARRITVAAGGNARIAIVLAEVALQFGEIKSLTDDELFQRLFWQRHAVDQDLLQSAQYLSLVYSFNADPESDATELETLGKMAEKTTKQLLKACRLLQQRDLLQQRGPWRAILPHAIANRLAGWALDEIPPAWIDGPEGFGGSPRLLRSFSHRLSMIGTRPQAQKIAARWLAPDGLLGDLTALNEDGRHMFVNIAAIDQMAALHSLERAASTDLWREFSQVIRSLAYEPVMFDRCAAMLYQVVTARNWTHTEDPIKAQWVSLFQILGSGTHATLAQRLALVEGLLDASDETSHAMGYAAVNQLLATSGFNASINHEFGARSRDYGYSARTKGDMHAWFAAVMVLCERRLVDHRDAMRAAFGSHLQGLWTRAGMYEEVDALARRIAADGFWPEGWTACRRILRYDQKKTDGDVYDRLVRLEAALRPTGLEQKVLAVLRARDWNLDFECEGPSLQTANLYERRAEAAKDLGVVIANDAVQLDRLNDEMHKGGVGAYPLGEGLAMGSTDLEALWQRLLAGFKALPAADRDSRALTGFLSELARSNRALASKLLDLAWQDASLSESLVELQLGIPLDARGLHQLQAARASGTISTVQLRAIGHASKAAPPEALRDFLIAIADDSVGTHTALNILSTRIWGPTAEDEHQDPAVLDAARQLFSRLTLDRSQHLQSSDYELSDLIRRTLPGAGGQAAAQQFSQQLVRDLLEDRVYAFEHTDLMRALLEVHPVAVLDAWFEAAGQDGDAAARLLQSDKHHTGQPTDIVPADKVLEWCNKEPLSRYAMAASFVPFAAPTESSDDGHRWSTQAQQLLIHAPDKDVVLERLTEQFTPSSWSGSRATIMERNAGLLDQVSEIVPCDKTPALAGLKRRLAEEIEAEHAYESRMNRNRYERFE